MATQWSVNQKNNGSLAMFQLVQTMISGGWVQMGSGDASTWATGSVGPVVNGGTGATGLNNNAAWIRLQTPTLTFGGTSLKKEVLIQRGNADTDWWLRYSPAGNFSGGSPSATVAPTATDQVNLYGTAQSAATGFFPTLSNTATYSNCMCYDASGSYGFYLFTFPAGGAIAPLYTAFVFDPVTNGSSLDKDPYIWYLSGWAANTFSTTHFGGDSSMFAFMSTTLTTANYVAVQAAQYYQYATATVMLPAGVGVDPFGSADTVWPIVYTRRSGFTTNVGYKGWGTIMKYPGVQRSLGGTLSVVTTNDYINMNKIVLPWNGSNPLV